MDYTSLVCYFVMFLEFVTVVMAVKMVYKLQRKNLNAYCTAYYDEYGRLIIVPPEDKYDNTYATALNVALDMDDGNEIGDHFVIGVRYV